MLQFNLVPGACFFGAYPENGASVILGCSVSRMRLSLPTGPSRILNVRGLSFFGAGSQQILPHPEWKTRQSSLYSDGMSGADILYHRDLHTVDEPSPYWEAEFPHPTFISRIEILNRFDAWGARCAGLTLSVMLPDGAWVTWWQNNQAQASIHLQHVLVEMGLDPNGSPEDTRAAILARLKRVLEPGFQGRWWAAILTTISFRVGKKWDWFLKKAIHYEADVVAAYLLWRAVVIGDAPIQGLQQFQSLFPTKESIRDLEDRLNDLALHCNVNGQFRITRHGVHHSPLMGPIDGYVHSLNQLFDFLRSEGFAAVICYGTLLGARRTGSFIPGDDDIDVLAMNENVRSREEAHAKARDLASKLRSAGWAVGGEVGDNLNFHARFGEGCEIDIFLCWEANDRIFLHMQEMNLRSLQKNIIMPAGSIGFLGTQMPCPANVDGFLQERYGPNWREPDHFFEWPWSLLP